MERLSLLLGLPPTVFGLRASWLSSIVMVSCAFPFTLMRVRYLALFSPIGLISTITLGVSSIAAPLWALHVHGGIDMQCEPLDGSVREATMSHAAFLPEGVGFAASLILFSYADLGDGTLDQHDEHPPVRNLLSF